MQRIISKIASGYSSSLYLVEMKDGSKLPMKYELFDRMLYQRQLRFDEHVASKYPNHFLVIARTKSSIVDRKFNPRTLLDEKLNVPESVREYHRSLKPNCCYYIYDKVCEPINVFTMSEVEAKKCFNNIMESIEIMRAANYEHRDIIPDNIMYCSKIDRYILVDYGSVIHSSDRRDHFIDSFIAFSHSCDTYKLVLSMMCSRIDMYLSNNPQAIRPFTEILADEKVRLIMDNKLVRYGNGETKELETTTMLKHYMHIKGLMLYPDDYRRLVVRDEYLNQAPLIGNNSNVNRFSSTDDIIELLERELSNSKKILH